MILPLEKQVCNLEISQRIKELGVKQESLWYWEELMNENFEMTNEFILTGREIGSDNYSAFTVSELGEIMAGNGMGVGGCATLGEKEWWVSGGEWVVETQKYSHVETAPTEANARGSMLIYLLENKLEVKQ